LEIVYTGDRIEGSNPSLSASTLQVSRKTMSSTLALLYIPIDTQKHAEELATLALSHKLAACVNILPGGQSLYLWEGHIENASECYMLFKTLPEKQHELKTFILAHHPYDIPAILTLSPDCCAPFLDYLSTSLGCRTEEK
jgi:periplasmic divalent cation tolerance protein